MEAFFAMIESGRVFALTKELEAALAVEDRVAAPACPVGLGEKIAKPWRFLRQRGDPC